MTLESQRLKSEIGSRDDLLQRIDTETVLVEEVHTYYAIYCPLWRHVFINHGVLSQERAKAEKINRKLRQQLADFRVPDVMDYVQEKADLYDIQKKVRSWERKVEIAEVWLDRSFTQQTLSSRVIITCFTHRWRWKHIGSNGIQCDCKAKCRHLGPSRRACQSCKHYFLFTLWKLTKQFVSPKFASSIVLFRYSWC